MLNKPIEQMDFKELRKTVQELSDTIAVMKRKYEDLLYNIGRENFSTDFVIQQDDMKTQINISAEALKTKVSAADLSKKLENYSEIKQTADAIKAVVSKSADDYVNALEIKDIKEATDTGKIYVIRKYAEDDETIISETYYYYNDLVNDWCVLSGDNIYTVFTQTPDGFELKGNTIIDGNAVVTRNLTLKGNVTWDMDNSPVLTRYSSDDENWHSPMEDGDIYMQMSFDGGSHWSISTKVVGTDSEVTPGNVFAALTDEGEEQGLFAVFKNQDNQLYINAEFIQAGILRGQTLQSFMSFEESGYGEYAEMDGKNGSINFYHKSRDGVPELRFQMLQAGGVTWIQNVASTLYIGNPSTEGHVNTTYPVGNWDFSNCTEVVGVKAIFG